MDKGTGVGWRSALMAPVCFVIRSGVKRRRGRNGGWSDDEAKRNGPTEKRRRREDRYPGRQNKASVRERKKENTEKKRLGAN